MIVPLASCSERARRSRRLRATAAIEIGLRRVRPAWLNQAGRLRQRRPRRVDQARALRSRRRSSSSVIAKATCRRGRSDASNRADNGGDGDDMAIAMTGTAMMAAATAMMMTTLAG
jgi:hypothetical protein